ncbi:MAG: UDP-N-acetylglucosamine 2-epimerase (non-hydrolyzing) [Micavibrio aeruginosavorus]|uniref:UDP-N-acetylglucosamine 2-epimerase (Non-hydrolyzing) n=1 Tax=Micavibrio aeruginosavorus TaxID=349221 RepID=A0A2W5FNZ0_9BACT|nr:MAG: UDP-N-acetylglucosamine 2-epimerase (non-hydrolyzing) [Micavibrio aeruginosavorus]
MNMNARKDILIVAGARPNFMKISPIIRALSQSNVLRGHLIHTGQHHDDAMSGSFFRDLGIPEPEINLQVSSGSQSHQTGEIIQKFEPVLQKLSPSAVLVVGDVTSTLACALVAIKNHVPVIHVEAGLRSYDRAMPEEINRVLTDQIADFLFTTEREASDNLKREGISEDKIHFVGNVMVDCLEYNLTKAVPASETLKDIGIKNYALLTLHRPSNVDSAEILRPLMEAIARLSKTVPVVFPIHPRTRNNIKKFIPDSVFNEANIHLIEPQPYLAMLGLMRQARLVLTDSGGLQEETTSLGVPCFTLRDNTERWITVTQGTNVMVGTNPDALDSAMKSFLSGQVKSGTRPELWDGKAAERIVSILEKSLCAE